MSSIKQLKKDIGNQIIKVIDECSYWELDNPKADTKKSQGVIDNAIAVYDELILKVNAKNIENKKSHYKSIREELASKMTDLYNKIEKL